MSGEREPNRPPVLVRFAVGALAKSYEDLRSWTGQVRDDIARLPDEIKKIPSNLASIPVQAVTDAVSSALRLQQNFNALVIKGDETLEFIFHKPEEKPDWATFDEDEDDEIPTPAPAEARTIAPVTPIVPPAPSAVEEPAEPKKPAAQAKPSAQPLRQATARATTKPVTAKPATKKPATAAKPQTSKPKTEKPATGKTTAAKPLTPPSAPAAKPVKARPATAAKPAAPKKPAEPKPEAPKAEAASKASRPELVDYLEYGTLSLAQLRARARNLSVPELHELLSFERANGNRPPFVTLLENRITASGA